MMPTSEIRFLPNRRGRKASALAFATCSFIAGLGCDVEVPPRSTQRASVSAESPLATATRLSRQFEATVDEVLQVPGYTYASVVPKELAWNHGESTARSPRPIWVATLKRELSVGDVATVTLIAEREQFRSSHLGRVFPSLFFGVVRRRAPASPTEVGDAVSTDRGPIAATKNGANVRR